MTEELRSMKEYIVYLREPTDITLILALDFEEVKQITIELYGYQRVVKIVLCSDENLGETY